MIARPIQRGLLAQQSPGLVIKNYECPVCGSKGHAMRGHVAAAAAVHGASPAASRTPPSPPQGHAAVRPAGQAYGVDSLGRPVDIAGNVLDAQGRRILVTLPPARPAFSDSSSYSNAGIWQPTSFGPYDVTGAGPVTMAPQIVQSQPMADVQPVFFTPGAPTPAAPMPPANNTAALLVIGGVAVAGIIAYAAMSRTAAPAPRVVRTVVARARRR